MGKHICLPSEFCVYYYAVQSASDGLLSLLALLPKYPTS